MQLLAQSYIQYGYLKRQQFSQKKLKFFNQLMGQSSQLQYDLWLQYLKMYQNTKFKQAQLRENQIGSQFISCPFDDTTRVFINGQITSAEDFPQSQLFISYKISIPEKWKKQINQQYKAYDLTEEQLLQLNCLQSVTHATLPILQKNKQGEVITKFYFSFPIDLQFLKKDDATQSPIIHLQVLSKDSWERIRLHGCGFVKVPKEPGFYTLTTQTWKPLLDQRTRVMEYFLGGIIKLKDIQQISKQQRLTDMDQYGPINRSNYKAVSSGKVNVRLNVATQSKSVKNDERIIYRDQKYSQQTQAKKKQMPLSIPGLVNTGKVEGSRHTNTKLQ